MLKVKPKRPYKSTRAEVDRRVAEVFGLICDGACAAYILEFSREKWGMKPAQTWNYLARARQEVKKMVEAQYPTVLQEAVATYDKIVHKALHEGTVKYSKDGEPYTDLDYFAAKAALTDKMKLLGFMKNQVVLSGSVTNEDREKFGDWKPEELETFVH